MLVLTQLTNKCPNLKPFKTVLENILTNYWPSRCMHCPKKNLKFLLKTVSVMDGTDATVFVWCQDHIDVNIRQTYIYTDSSRSIAMTGSVFLMRRFRLILGECIRYGFLDSVYNSWVFLKVGITSVLVPSLQILHLLTIISKLLQFLSHGKY